MSADSQMIGLLAISAPDGRKFARFTQRGCLAAMPDNRSEESSVIGLTKSLTVTLLGRDESG
jgi:hypothetical protein